MLRSLGGLLYLLFPHSSPMLTVDVCLYARLISWLCRHVWGCSSLMPCHCQREPEASTDRQYGASCSHVKSEHCSWLIFCDHLSSWAAWPSGDKCQGWSETDEQRASPSRQVGLEGRETSRSCRCICLPGTECGTRFESYIACTPDPVHGFLGKISTKSFFVQGRHAAC